MRALIEEMPKQRTMKEINMKVQDSDGCLGSRCSPERCLRGWGEQ